jgi:site-specific DNA recombinase
LGRRRKRQHSEPFEPLRQRGNGPTPDVSWIRAAIRQPLDRLLSVLIYARYSTEDQNPRSIDAQIEYCRAFLAALGVTHYKLEILRDVEISGQLRYRPGIDKVCSGVRKRRWGLILVEDASRLYRHDSWAVDLVGVAHDLKIRTICITDRVDSNEPVDLWLPRLKDATRTHAQSNWYTSHRIKRQLEYLWSIKAAIGALRPGYRRIPTTPATEKTPAEGPFFDEIAEEWAPKIHSAFEQVAANDPPWNVARCLTEQKIPKTSNSTSPEWSDKNVISLIRETIYRGWDIYRERHSTPLLETGKKRAERSETSEMLTREMPHLRIVSDELWAQANAAIDGRRPKRTYVAGLENPLYGIPRDSRSLLSTLFKCGVCGAPLHRGGRSGKAYVCSAVKRRKCWNRASADDVLTDNAVKNIVRDQLGALDDVVDEFLRRLNQLTGDQDTLHSRAEQLDIRQKKLERKSRELVKAIESRTKKPEHVLQRIDELEVRLRKTAEKSNQIERLLSGAMIPTREEVSRRLQTVMSNLDAAQMTAGVALRKVIRRIEAIPFLQWNSSVVVLRGRIIVDIAGLLSVELASVLAELNAEGLEKEFQPTIVTVDLFVPSTGPLYGRAAEALERERGLRLSQVATELGINKRRANIALQYGRAMRNAGISDAFVELTSPPQKAAHWGPRKVQSVKEAPPPTSQLAGSSAS